MNRAKYSDISTKVVVVVVVVVVVFDYLSKFPLKPQSTYHAINYRLVPESCPFCAMALSYNSSLVRFTH